MQTTHPLKPFIHQSFYGYEGRYPRSPAWVLSTDHKRIGLLYFVSVPDFLLVGVILGFFDAPGADRPGPTIMDPRPTMPFLPSTG